MSNNSDPMEEVEPILNLILIAPAIILLNWIGVTYFLYTRYYLLAVNCLEALVSITIP